MIPSLLLCAACAAGNRELQQPAPSAPAGKAKTRFGIVFKNPMIPSAAGDPPSSSTT